MSSANYIALITQLVEARKAKNLSQRALAELLGMGQPHLAHWERRAKFPSLGSLLRWANTLGCQLNVEARDDRSFAHTD